MPQNPITREDTKEFAKHFIEMEQDNDKPLEDLIKMINNANPKLFHDAFFTELDAKEGDAPKGNCVFIDMLISCYKATEDNWARKAAVVKAILEKGIKLPNAVECTFLLFAEEEIMKHPGLTMYDASSSDNEGLKILGIVFDFLYGQPENREDPKEFAKHFIEMEKDNDKPLEDLIKMINNANPKLFHDAFFTEWDAKEGDSPKENCVFIDMLISCYKATEDNWDRKAAVVKAILEKGIKLPKAVECTFLLFAEEEIMKHPGLTMYDASSSDNEGLKILGIVSDFLYGQPENS